MMAQRYMFILSKFFFCQTGPPSTIILIRPIILLEHGFNLGHDTRKQPFWHMRHANWEAPVWVPRLIWVFTGPTCPKSSFLHNVAHIKQYLKRNWVSYGPKQNQICLTCFGWISLSLMRVNYIRPEIFFVNNNSP